MINEAALYVLYSRRTTNLIVIIDNLILRPVAKITAAVPASP